MQTNAPRVYTFDKLSRARELVRINDEAGWARDDTAQHYRRTADEFRAAGNREAASLFKQAAQQAERGW